MIANFVVTIDIVVWWGGRGALARDLGQQIESQ